MRMGLRNQNGTISSDSLFDRKKMFRPSCESFSNGLVTLMPTK